MARKKTAKKKAVSNSPPRSNGPTRLRAIPHFVPKPVGRPSDYCLETCTAICDRMTAGESLLQICRDPLMPAKTTIMRWLQEHKEFRDHYTQARENLVEYWAEETVEISDDGSNDWMERETRSGRMIECVNNEHVTRSALRVNTRKWLCAQLQPKKYGSKVDLNLGGQENGVPIQHENARDRNRNLINAVSARLSGTTPGEATGTGEEPSDILPEPGGDA